MCAVSCDGCVWGGGSMCAVSCDGCVCVWGGACVLSAVMGVCVCVGGGGHVMIGRQGSRGVGEIPFPGAEHRGLPHGNCTELYEDSIYIHTLF